MARTFYLTLSRCTDAEFLQLQAGGDAPAAAPAISGTFPGTGWTVGTTAATVYARMDSRAERAAAAFGGTAQPSGAPDASLGDCCRSILPLSGIFSAGNWVISVSVKADTSGGAQDGNIRVRLWRSRHADGSSATELTSGATDGTAVTNLATSVAQVSVATIALGAKTFRDEYLFVQLAWKLTGAGGSATDDVLIQLGVNSSITTPAWTPANPTDGEWVLEIDWRDTHFARTGHVIDAYIDCTRHLRQVPLWRRGRDDASHLKGRSTAGEMHVELDNQEGIYSTFDTSSVLAGSVLPGHLVRLRFVDPVDKHEWTGPATLFHPTADLEGSPICLVDAVGRLNKLAGDTISAVPNTGARTDQQMEAVLIASGLTSADYDLSPGDVVTGYWIEQGVKGLDAGRRIEDTELGFVLEDGRGRIKFENRNFRIHTARCNTSQATYSDADGSPLSYRDIEEGDPLREIFDKVLITVQPIVIGTEPSIIWQAARFPYAPTVPPASSRTFSAIIRRLGLLVNRINPDPTFTTSDLDQLSFISSWITPVIGSTYPAADIVPASIGADYDPADLTITVLETGPKKMDFTLTNANPTLTAEFNVFVIRGYLGLKLDPIQIHAGEGTRVYPYPGQYYGSAESAQDAAQRIYTEQRYPRSNVAITIPANRSAAALADAITREISDRIHIVADNERTKLAVDQDYWLESLGGSIDRNRTFTRSFNCLAVNPTQLSGPVFGASPDDILRWDEGAWDDNVWG